MRLTEATRSISQWLDRLLIPADLLDRARAPRDSRSFRTSGGLRVDCMTAGEGPTPVIFVPEAGVACHGFDPQLRHFDGSRSCRALAIDSAMLVWYRALRLCPTRAEEAEPLHALFARLPLRGAVLVGRSSGMRAVLEYVRRAGTDRLSGCVLLDGPCSPVDLSSAKSRELAALDATLPQLFIVRHDSRAVVGWAQKHAGQVDVATLRPDLMTSEYHDTVNAAIDRFIIRLFH